MIADSWEEREREWCEFGFLEIRIPYFIFYSLIPAFSKAKDWKKKNEKTSDFSSPLSFLSSLHRSIALTVTCNMPKKKEGEKMFRLLRN